MFMLSAVSPANDSCCMYSWVQLHLQLAWLLMVVDNLLCLSGVFS